MDLPYDSPELQFGLHIYHGGTLNIERLLYVNNITIQIEGTLLGVDNLVIGNNGTLIIRYVCIYFMKIIGELFLSF